MNGGFPRKSSKSCCCGEGHLELPGSANVQEMQNYLKSVLFGFGVFLSGCCNLIITENLDACGLPWSVRMSLGF